MFARIFVVTIIVAAVAAHFGGRYRPKRNSFVVEPGPLVKATRGGLWPKPQQIITTHNYFIVRPGVFQFKVIGKTCNILEEALNRYKQDLKSQEKMRRTAKGRNQSEGRKFRFVNESHYKGYLDQLSVDLGTDCELWPHENMDEHYELILSPDHSPGKFLLVSQSIWGILRGLETWSQLVYPSIDFHALVVNSSSVTDFPRFSHRGLLIDTSRHFLPPRIIYLTLDAMAMSKMNVLHWHVVDDQSFPFESKQFPDLSAKGAYSSYHVYTSQDVQNIIDHARKRGIRIIPEFDTPGHTRSWGVAYPKLLTECYNGGLPDGTLGPMNPIAKETYVFVQQILKEIKETFPDSYIHLGGDEVEFQCWSSNPELRDYMMQTSTTVKELQGNYMREIIEGAYNLSAKSIVWQEVFDDGAHLNSDTVVHVWKGNYRSKIKEITFKGHKAILSSCWYLDALTSGGDWHEFYQCDPNDFLKEQKLKDLVIGGEACMWGEVVDVNNLISRIWPRACAAAEKLWSPCGPLDIHEASRRLEEHTCRMNRRKIPAQPPNGPGFCPGINYS
ncbi:hypothetical protein RUM44_005516 [Polyplax serrata]|uniref:Beta-hexosaminidase n=1 Tax=Polyplax serrata TaxID=468196 RepID=A0ABR1ADL3_POLSC